MEKEKQELILEEGERLDATGFGTLRLIQKPGEFCYGVDAVLLAAFAVVRKGQKVIDLGTGTGIIPLILSHKTEAEQIWGVELQRDAWNRAVRMAKLNGLDGRLQFLHCDVKNVLDYFEPETFDVVVSNPPYVRAVSGLKSSNTPKMLARHETTAGLYDFMEKAAALLRKGGALFMIHRPERIPDLCCYGREVGMEVKEMRLVSTNRDVKPSMVLVRCVKGGGSELRFREPLYIYRKNGEYTSEIQQIYERKNGKRKETC